MLPFLVEPLSRCFEKAYFQFIGRSAIKEAVQDNPLTPELKKRGAECLEILESTGFLSAANCKYIESLVTFMQRAVYKFGEESRHLAGLARDSGADKIQPQELREAVQDLIQIAAKGPGRNGPTITNALFKFYSEALSAGETATTRLISDFRTASPADLTAAALKLAALLPADAISIKLMKELLEHVEAPLSARRHETYMPIHYSGEMMAATLAARNFQKSNISEFSELSGHSQRAIYLIKERSNSRIKERSDSYDTEAMKQLLYGSLEKEAKLQTQPDYAVVAAILIFNPNLITDHNLQGLCEVSLPFSPEENKQLVNKLTHQDSQIEPDSLIANILKTPVLFSHKETATRVLGPEFDPVNLSKIVILARFINHHREYR